MNPIGLDYLTLFGLHPLDYVETAAKAGADTVALPPCSMDPLPAGFAAYSFLDDAALRRDFRSCLDDNGVKMGMIDGLAVWPGRDVSEYEAAMAGLAEMGVTLANTVSFDASDRSVDQFGKLVAMAGPYGIDIVLESCPVLTIQTVAQALEIIAAINQPHFGLLVDTLHVSRSGEVDLLKAIDPGLIRYVQLCDAPLAQPANAAAYMDQALYERMLPGDGELPLLDILALVQDDVIVSAEIPLRQHLARGVPHVEIARQAIQRSKEIMGAARSLHGIG